MQKIQRSSGKSFETLMIDGKQYTLRPLKVGVYGEMEAFVASLRVDPLEAASAAVQKLPSAHHAAIWDAAMRAVMTGRNVTTQEMANFENSLAGYAWKLWQCLKQDHPEIDSIAKATELLEKAGPERAVEIDAKLRVATGEADLGQSSGPTPVMEDQGQAGQPSTSSSSSTTA
jgi:hypothetical protein